MIIVEFEPIPKRIVQGRRLVYYLRKPDASFWDALWLSQLSEGYYKNVLKGELWWFEGVFTKYLSKGKPILEAGCGTGMILVALNARGYQCDGIEWAEKTVETVKKIFPGLPIFTGNLTKLDIPDEYYQSYISIGVIEHSQEGPEPFLSEAWRILVPGGIMLVSVPHFNLLRRIKAFLHLFRDQPNGLDFYQYAYTSKELGLILEKQGFNIIDKYYYNAYKGAIDEIPWLPKMFNLRGIGRRLKRLLRSSNLAQYLLGHMIMFICTKKASR